MNKQKLIVTLSEQLEKDLVTLKASAKASYEAATNEESRPENEYDTRALELSYLARAQAERVLATEQLLTILKHTEIKNYNSSMAISSTALVEVELNGHNSFLFILAKGGGHAIQFQGHPIQIITPNSPLGEALVGLKVGDTCLVEIGSKTREYDIISVQ